MPETNDCEKQNSYAMHSASLKEQRGRNMTVWWLTIYRPMGNSHDGEDVFDYAHTVGFPANWVDWAELNVPPPNPPAMIPGVQRMGDQQARNVIAVWEQYRRTNPA